MERQAQTAPAATGEDAAHAANGHPALDEELVRQVVARALAEDVGSGDITTAACVPEGLTARARAVARQPGILAGVQLFSAAFQSVSPHVHVAPRQHDGDVFDGKAVLCEVEGPARALLTAERVALNFLQRACGIATLTSRYVRAVAGTRAVILDTRKTVPGLRLLDKYAVRVGGGRNHRMGLFDGMLVKDNHIRAAGGITAAVSRAREKIPAGVSLLEVECETLDQVVECLGLGVEMIMLDNMSLNEMTKAVAMGAGRAKFEASGSITLESAAGVARTGVDFISIGSLTHSATALDIGLDFD